MIPLYLVLGHLAADFILQPHSLVKLKEKSFTGVIAHACVHLLISMLFLLPFFNNPIVWIAILIITVSHAIIDQGKISLQLRTDQYLYPFALDQFFHFSVIFAVILALKLQNLQIPDIGQTWIATLYGNQNFPIFLMILVFVTSVYDIMRFQLQLEENRNSKYKFNFKKLASRILVAGAVFLGFLMLGWMV